MEHPSKFLYVGEVGFYYFNDSGESKVTKAYDDTKERPFMTEKWLWTCSKRLEIWLLLQ